jgi:ABC-2 type transport system permease protein
MSAWKQTWLVAQREIRERSRSRAFLLSVILTVVAVITLIVLPAALSSGGGTKHVGLTGAVPAGLPATIEAQGHAFGITVHTQRYDTLAAGERAVRDKHIDVLVADARQLEWPRTTDAKLQAVVTGAIQLDAVQNRAASAGISPQALSALLAPVPVNNVELGAAPGRSPDDEAAAQVLTMLLLLSIATFGGLVLNGVVEEKTSRVVEVLLTRIPARNLLAGKITGIGLLGLTQIVLAGLAALVATAAVSAVHLPSVRAAVVVWAVVWFVLGYAIYATAFGALGSLASRAEDAQSVTGPVTVALIVGYVVSLAAIGSPTTTWATVVSLIPLTAPLAMPGRIAMGAAAWWQPALAVALTLATVAGLVYVGGRLYVRAILHSGSTLSLRDAWSRTRSPAAKSADVTGKVQRWPTILHFRKTTGATPTSQQSHPLLLSVIIGAGVALGVLVAVLSHDVMIGVIVAAALIAVANQIVRLWTGHNDRTLHQP